MFSLHLITVATGLAVICLFSLSIRTLERRIRLRAMMPPGPRLRWFGLGDNGRDIPDHQPWKQYANWHRQYGEHSVDELVGRNTECTFEGAVVSAVVGNTNIIGRFFSPLAICGISFGCSQSSEQSRQPLIFWKSAGVFTQVEREI